MEVGDNLTSEMVPLLFPVEKDGETFREASFVYILNLIDKLTDRLESFQGYDV